MFKAVEEISKNLSSLRSLLSDAEHGPETAVIVANEVYATDLLPVVIQHLNKIDFEARKDAVYIFGNLLRRQVGSRFPTVEYMSRSPATLESLVKGYQGCSLFIISTFK